MISGSTTKVLIRGVPYGQRKTRGDLSAPGRWTDAVIAQTADVEPVDGPCQLDVTFLLPPDKYPADLPHGPDLDNLLKRFQDALNQTVFAEVEGADSSIVEVSARKSRVASSGEAGARLVIKCVKEPRA